MWPTQSATRRSFRYPCEQSGGENSIVYVSNIAVKSGKTRKRSIRVEICDIIAILNSYFKVPFLKCGSIINRKTFIVALITVTCVISNVTVEREETENVRA